MRDEKLLDELVQAAQRELLSSELQKDSAVVEFRKGGMTGPFGHTAVESRFRGRDAWCRDAASVASQPPWTTGLPGSPASAINLGSLGVAYSRPLRMTPKLIPSGSSSTAISLPSGNF